MAEERPSTLLLWLTIVAAPAALALETGLRLLLLPAEFPLVREFLRPTLTPVAWLFAALAGLGGLFGLWLQKRLVTKRIARLPDDANTRARRYQAGIGIFLLTSAAPQLPSILATFCFMFGASLLPVAAAIVLTTAGVLAQAWQVSRLAA